MMSLSYLSLGDTANALAAAQKALELMPGNPFAYYRMGQVYMKMNDLSDARQALQIAQQIAPQIPDIQKALKDLEGLEKKNSFAPSR
jgi:cytochrome c-type biogenesis protein CcmH/NrfG